MKDANDHIDEHRTYFYSLTKRTRLEEIKMWQDARKYYLDNDWHELAEAAEKQIIRVADEVACELVNRNARIGSPLELRKT